jgi:DNA-binding GntR family transcriptional regulator
MNGGSFETLSQRLGRREPIAGQITESIRSMIVGGQLDPGERIVESRIAREIGVGQPTVREALVALEHEGLVVRRANQGCVVTELSREDIRQLVRIRAELEVLAVQLAAESASDEDIAALVEAAEALKAAAAKRDSNRFFKLDLQFHQTLWRLSGNTFLPRLLEQTLGPLLAFLFIRNIRRRLDIDLKKSAQAHLDMARAIESRDVDKARATAREKLLWFADQHLALLDSQDRPGGKKSSS